MNSDLELLDRWRAGDQSAGNALFQRHFDSVCRFFENKLPDDVDELVQATFLACMRGRDQFRKQCSFRTYLFTIARHELYGYLRRRQRDGQVLDFHVTSLMDLGTTPTGRMARDQDREILLHALRSLPVEQQMMLELHYWEDMDFAELAEVFKIEPTTVRTRMFRARKALRERMQGQGARLASTSVEDLDAWARALRVRRARDESD